MMFRCGENELQITLTQTRSFQRNNSKLYFLKKVKEYKK